MKSLSDRDVTWIASRRLPKPVRELLRSRSDVFLAGGFIRSCIAGEDVNDIDLFAPSVDVASLVALTLADGSKVIKTDNAFTVFVDDITVQVIHRWTYTAASDCIESFDFTIARACIWFQPRSATSSIEKWCSLCDDDFYSDLAAKRLVYCSPKRNEDAGGSLLRVLKFYQRGYRIPLDSMGAVLSRLFSAIDLSLIPPGDEREQQVARVVAGLLLEVDPTISFREVMNQS